MAISPGVALARKLLKVMEQEGKTGEEIALEVLVKAWELYEEKAKFYTAVQIITVDGQRLRRGDPRGGSVFLGPFSTEKAAMSAAYDARMIRGGRVTCLAAVIPTAHGATPSGWTKDLLTPLTQEVDEAERRLEKWHLDHEFHDLIYGRRVEICGRMFLRDNLIAFCDRPHKHPGKCVTYAPRLPTEDITGYSQSIPLDLPAYTEGEGPDQDASEPSAQAAD